MDSRYYTEELARVHHESYGQLAREAAQYILRISDPKTHSRVVDLGCGTGILAGILSKVGYMVTGVEYSADMLEIAHREAPEADFVRASIYDYVIPECDIVCMTGEVINYLFDDQSDPESVKKLFTRIYQSLRPGGRFVFDVLTPWAQSSRKEVALEAWTMEVSVDVDPHGQILRREINLIPKQQGQRVREVHRQRLLLPAMLISWLTQIGFEVAPIDRYGRTVFREGHIGFSCRKEGGR